MRCPIYIQDNSLLLKLYCNEKPFLIRSIVVKESSTAQKDRIRIQHVGKFKPHLTHIQELLDSILQTLYDRIGSMCLALSINGLTHDSPLPHNDLIGSVVHFSFTGVRFDFQVPNSNTGRG
jgi:hypothetical protein